MKKKNYFILTGAPGSGKTSVLDSLRERITCVEEPARRVLKDNALEGEPNLSERKPGLFVELLLEYSIESYDRELQGDGFFLFDRGVPDVMAYAEWYCFPLQKFKSASLEYEYNPLVFVAEPWEEIYTQDSERKMTFAQTQVFHEMLLKSYESLGYILIPLPNQSVADRAQFILSKIKQNSL